MSQDTSVDDRDVAASRRLVEVFDPSMIDALLTDAQESGTPLDGVDGLLNQINKAVIERVLEREMTHERGTRRVRARGIPVTVTRARRSRR